jgi:hypothetical protein
MAGSVLNSRRAGDHPRVPGTRPPSLAARRIDAPMQAAVRDLNSPHSTRCPGTAAPAASRSRAVPQTATARNACGRHGGLPLARRPPPPERALVLNAEDDSNAATDPRGEGARGDASVSPGTARTGRCRAWRPRAPLTDDPFDRGARFPTRWDGKRTADAGRRRLDCRLPKTCVRATARRLGHRSATTAMNDEHAVTAAGRRGLRAVGRLRTRGRREGTSCRPSSTAARSRPRWTEGRRCSPPLVVLSRR